MKSYRQLIDEFESKPPLPTGKTYKLLGLDGKLGYNPSAPFTIHAPGLKRDIKVMYVRVESFDCDWFNRLLPVPGVYDVESVLFYEPAPDVWRRVTPQMMGGKANGLIFAAMEDPFVTKIDSDQIVGGVVIDFSKASRLIGPVAADDDAHFDYTRAGPTVTVDIYKGPGPAQFKKLVNIRSSKEIRLAQLSDGSILVTTRPQGGEAGIGSIGVFRINDLSELTQERVDTAPIIKGLVTPDLKIGPNEMCTLGSGPSEKVGVLAHIAANDSAKNLHYIAGAFCILNPYSLDEGIKTTPMKVIARRSDWPPTDKTPKRSTLADVIFPTALVRGSGSARLFCSLNDVALGYIDIPDPFV